MSSTKDKILVIEDNSIWQQRFQKWLGSNYAYSFATTKEDACKKFSDILPDIVLQDLGLPETSIGLEILDYIVRQGTDAKIIVITSSQDHQHALEAQKRGAHSYFFTFAPTSEEWQSWLIAPVLKTGVPERVPGVRIPPPPLHPP